MNQPEINRTPNKREKITIRLMIVLGLFSILLFFYWFIDSKLIENQLLFWLLIATIGFEAFKVAYIWYHYWDISRPEKPKAKSNFTVDVFTTYFPGEPYEMVKETLLAIQNIKYPHTTYLCDEGNDSYLKNFCKENNIIHVTRNNRVDAKAGNINNALKRAKGDLCLILDPDHVPKETILEELVPFFEDESIGFVQSVQAYSNIKESSVARGAAEQTFHFYGPVMMSMNSYGTVNAIGANCIFRRKALDSIGGHAAGLSEDMHTAMQMHAKGWKSVYVPKALTSGLVPSTLTGYYKQQLKWSRGTLELLVSVYPKLFRKFSLRQKIHYGILPLYYFSGVIYLITFLIPVFSLFFATMPWKGNILNFGLIFFPVLSFLLGIRLYIQNWVIHKSERGFHVTGAFLLNSAWWIYLIGFIYTIIRKKVPYLPTPKEDKERTNWKILIPNLVLGVVSIVAVIYGLSIDFTPFTIFMSGFALLNATFMFSTFVFAYQKQKDAKLRNAKANDNSMFNVIQDYAFRLWHKAALPVITILFVFFIVYVNFEDKEKWKKVTSEIQNKYTSNYLGIFNPSTTDGITNLQMVREISNKIDEKFNIISFYLAWNEDLETTYPQLLLDSIYNQNSLPLITWEPWINSFELENEDNKHVFELINEGYFDTYLKKFSANLKNTQRPVFFRFAHEFDNPAYPWFVNEKDSTMFKKAWKHVYEIFRTNEADNVIWIWNPWKSENVTTFYPGKEFVDWIGVDILNYGEIDDKYDVSFRNIYNPFHDEFKKLPLSPVMIAEFGALRGENQTRWINEAFNSIENEFTNIKSVIYFNSSFDKNWPEDRRTTEFLDWKVSNEQIVEKSFNWQQVSDYVFSPLNQIELLKIDSITAPSHLKKLKGIKGVNIRKGYDWRKDYHILNRKNLLSDFGKIERLGINTIKFEGNSIYEYNLMNISKKFDFNIAYGFWIPSDIDFVNDTLRTRLLKESILDKISKYKHNTNVFSWVIENDIQWNQKDFYHKPELLYQNNGYILWLKALVSEIKEIDSIRPIVVDIEVNRQSINHVSRLLASAVEIDAFGLVVKDETYRDSLITYLNNNNIQFIYSEIGVDDLMQNKILTSNESFFITSWQDQYKSDMLTFNGITDRKDRYKTDYYKLQNGIKKTDFIEEFPQTRILKPSVLIHSNNEYGYYAMLYDKNTGWGFAKRSNDLRFEWSLIKCDNYGNYLSIKDIGKEAKVSVKIPKNHENYRLLLTTIKGEVVKQNITSLHTPLTQVKENPF